MPRHSQLMKLPSLPLPMAPVKQHPIHPTVIHNYNCVLIVLMCIFVSALIPNASGAPVVVVVGWTVLAVTVASAGAIAQ